MAQKTVSSFEIQPISNSFRLKRTPVSNQIKVSLAYKKSKGMSFIDRIKNAWNADIKPVGTDNSGVVTSYYDEKWERCAENLAVMLTAGLSVGAVTSMVLFRKIQFFSWIFSFDGW